MQLQAQIVLNTTGNYINWRYKFKIAFFRSIFVNILSECLFQRGSLGERCKLPQRGPGRSPRSQSIFRFYLASNPSAAVKNIIWLISLELNYY